MADVIFEKVEKVYDNDVHAVHDLSLEIRDGEFVVLVGPSGCGKTTALRMVAGLEDITDGKISIGDRVVNDLTPKERDIAMVFQNYALYPHLSVADNIGFGLRLRHTPKEIVEERVRWAANFLGLTPYLHRRPKELSGGQRQRVAMGRAIVRKPQVFLMDEPLSNLDAQLRVQTRTQIAALQRRLGITTIYVTHDQVEAMTMGDRVAVMFDGRLQQVDSPNSLYARPANRMVARFIGSPAMNLHEVPVTDGAADLTGYKIPLPRDVVARLTPSDGGRVVLGFRPEAIDVGANGSGLRVVTELVEELGADAYLFASLPGHERVSEVGDVVARIDPRRVPAKGEAVTITIRPDELHVLSPVSGERLN